MQNQYEQNKIRYRRKKRNIRITLIAIFTVITLVSSISYLFLNNILGNLKGKGLDKNDLGISKGAASRIANYGNDVKNILLIGLDEPDEPGAPQRSDSMIVFSFDEKHNDLKLSSLMRDTYVDIAGYGTDKLNHSYAYGGEQLLIKTINSNFGLDIEDYVLVNFHDMVNIIDAVGGVEIDVKEEEIPLLNEGVRNINKIEGHDIFSGYVTKPGLQNLTGIQATAYARIRRVGNGDYERTDRQRRVLMTIFNKVKNTSLVDMPSVLTQLSRYFKTSLTLQEMLDIGTKILGNKVDQMKQARFPTDWNLTEVNDPSVWYLSYDKAATIWEVGNFIYKDILPDQTYFNENYTEGTIQPDELEPASSGGSDTSTGTDQSYTQPAETYTEPETAPEEPAPDTQAPETYTPDTQAPETTAPPDTTPPETTSTPDTTPPETTSANTEPATTTAPETTTPDTTTADTTSPGTTQSTVP